ncbi:glutamate racemase [Dialister succinatiphilus]|uniref:glutamate racemase n=1 Tax=Dialister succinatiphilus TaxID=487173 RepID=UPI003F81503E
MDNRPIGIMDSGVGGLTVARVLHEKYPKESIIFLGDSLRNPYGERTRDEIARFAGEIKDFLIKKDVKMIIIACNTISFNVYPSFLEGPVPVVKMSLDITLPEGTKKAGIFATPASIRTHAHKKYVEKKFPEVEWVEVPCDGVAAAIEQGKDENFISALVQKAAKEYHALGIDAGYWACTHYPLAPSAFARVFPKVPFIDPALPTVEEGMAILQREDRLAEGKGRDEFYFTDGLAHAEPLVKRLFGPAAVEKTNLVGE